MPLDAKSVRPDGIISVDEIKDKVISPPEDGIPWFIPSLTDVTYGRRYGEVVALGAGTGVGKTTVLCEQINADLLAGLPVAAFCFEQAPAETVKRIAGLRSNKQYHVPNGEWTTDELEADVEELLNGAPLYLYDHFGACNWETVRQHIRYLNHDRGVRIFYLDHITALAAAEEDERRGLEVMMAEVSQLAQELQVWILFVSHLTTPEGKPHEEGGRVTIRHFKGSRAIGYWSHFIFGLERSQQAVDEDERNKTTFRILKDRFTGNGTGVTISLTYDKETGRITEDEMFDPLTGIEEEGEF
jgi:twinkle protein